MTGEYSSILPDINAWASRVDIKLHHMESHLTSFFVFEKEQNTSVRSDDLNHLFGLAFQFKTVNQPPAEQLGNN